ncbi:MAG: hypothetical protein WCL44_14720 [bacterium]
MDELGALIGGLVGIVLVICLVAWLIAIIVAIAIGVALLAGPPLGLGALLRRLLLTRYTLSLRKKWQCAGIAAIAFAAPFLALFADKSPMTCVAATWGGTVLALSAIVLLLVTSAYKQHFTKHRESIREARSTLVAERIRQKAASVKLWCLNRTLSRVERKHGALLGAQERLAAQMEKLIESNDPALCRIQLTHWENQYAALPAIQIENEINAVSGELAPFHESPQAASKLQSLFLEMQLISRKLNGDKDAARLVELKAEQDDLQRIVANCTESMIACQRVKTEKTATIAQLKRQRLVIQ